jgi:CDP-glucose 4,6-dehydratase
MSIKKWAAATVLVTGATGFFGGWLVRSLRDRGAHVVAVVRSRKPQSQFYLRGFDRDIQVEWGSVYDPEVLPDVLRRTQPDYFFHAAYGADVNRALTEPLECFRSSVESTWVALEVLRQSGKACVSIISSSDKAYGTQSLPYDERHALTPLHPYEVAKASMDLAAQSYGKIYGSPVAVTRCGNYFGPYDFNFTRLIPGVVRSVVRGEPPVLRSDGRSTRDFLYVEDAVEAHLLLADRLAEDRQLFGEPFNFSYGDQIQVIDIVRRIIEISGRDIQPVVVDDVRSEIRHMRLSSEKARRRLGWTPRFGFDAGLRQTVAWYESHLAGSPLAGAHGSSPAVGST